MPQFPIPAGHQIGDPILLNPADAKHLLKVLRGSVGDRVILFDGTKKFVGEIVSQSPRQTVVQMIEEIAIPKVRGKIVLAQSLLKKDKMEWVIQKSVELGAAEVIPFTSERTIIKMGARGRALSPSNQASIGLGPCERIDRWQKIADEALKQCGRVNSMKVQPVMKYVELMPLFPDKTEKILFTQTSPPIPLSLVRRGGEEGERALLLIGPEGGFSDREVEMARASDFLICSLGSFTLRAETAAIAALTLIQHELGNL